MAQHIVLLGGTVCFYTEFHSVDIVVGAVKVYLKSISGYHQVIAFNFCELTYSVPDYTFKNKVTRVLRSHIFKLFEIYFRK